MTEPSVKHRMILTFRAGIITGFHLFSTHPGMAGISTLTTFSQGQGPGAGVGHITDINPFSPSHRREL